MPGGHGRFLRTSRPNYLLDRCVPPRRPKRRSSPRLSAVESYVHDQAGTTNGKWFGLPERLADGIESGCDRVIGTALGVSLAAKTGRRRVFLAYCPGLGILSWPSVGPEVRAESTLSVSCAAALSTRARWCAWTLEFQTAIRYHNGTRGLLLACVRACRQTAQRFLSKLYSRNKRALDRIASIDKLKHAEKTSIQ